MRISGDNGAAIVGVDFEHTLTVKLRRKQPEYLNFHQSFSRCHEEFLTFSQKTSRVSSGATNLPWQALMIQAGESDRVIA